jgi:hypothetical protein
MSPERHHVPEPSEMIYRPRTSWAPPIFALGAVGLIAGIYAAGFVFSPWVYSTVGAILVLGAFRSLIAGGVRGYYRLPRRQRVRGAALPIEQIRLDD